MTPVAQLHRLRGGVWVRDGGKMPVTWTPKVLDRVLGLAHAPDTRVLTARGHHSIGGSIR